MAIVRTPRVRTRPKWKVRWRDGDKQRSKTFDRKEDAEAFESKVNLAKRRGDLAELDAGRERFDAFVETWWRLYGEDQLSAKTKDMYRSLLRRYLLPRLGPMELRRIDSFLVSQVQAEMLKQGTGRETTRKTLALLQGILERAVEWGRLRSNPARSVKKPTQRRQREVRPVTPETIEAMRRRLLSENRLRDATLISVLAYAGLRPSEALAMTWADIGHRTLRIDKALSLGEVVETKTRQNRTVPLLKPLGDDLKKWRKESGNPSGDRLVFPKNDGTPWQDHDLRNWRKRVFVPTARAGGWDTTRPYDLRHGLASLLFNEHRNPLEIAQILGHSPDVLFRSYAAVIPELLGAPSRRATSLITKARRF